VVPETLAKTADRYWNRDDRRSMIPILFERTWDEGCRYGGDIAFCRKWRAAGGKVQAAYEMRLGHAAKSIIWDSLGAGLRRQAGTTLRHIADQVRAGSDDLSIFSEARRFLHNPFGTLEDVLALCVIMARKADGPILETGSGLTTILMAAAAPEQTVYCIEHDPGWAAQLQNMAYSTGTTNIALCTQPINNGWYDLSDLNGELPEQFALALVDGPPRCFGSRMPFYERLGERCETIMVDDADDPGYAEAIGTWAIAQGRRIDFVGERAALIRKKENE
jgi:predicted O-methyltransferase YrrM